MVLQSLACGFEINGNVCVRAWLCVGLRLHHRRPRVSVEFELVRALAHERRRAGEGPVDPHSPGLSQRGGLIQEGGRARWWLVVG